MVAERKVIDIDDVPGMEALTRELDAHPEGLVLRRGGRRIAVLVSEASTTDTRGESPTMGKDDAPITSRPISGERLQRILEIVESMRGIDTGTMHRMVDESRQHSIAMQQRDDETGPTSGQP